MAFGRVIIGDARRLGETDNGRRWVLQGSIEPDTVDSRVTRQGKQRRNWSVSEAE
jgi:hypothetical protein